MYIHFQLNIILLGLLEICILYFNDSLWRNLNNTIALFETKYYEFLPINCTGVDYPINRVPVRLRCVKVTLINVSTFSTDCFAEIAACSSLRLSIVIIQFFKTFLTKVCALIGAKSEILFLIVR